MKKQKLVPVHVLIDQDLHDTLRRIADSSEFNVSDLIRLSIRFGLKEVLRRLTDDEGPLPGFLKEREKP